MSETKVIRESSFDSTTNGGYKGKLTYKILSDGIVEDAVLIIKEIYIPADDTSFKNVSDMKFTGHYKDGTLVFEQAISLKLSTFKELFERVFI